MPDFIKSRNILIEYLKGEMHGPLNIKNLNFKDENIQIYSIDDTLSFDTFKDASRLSIQDNGQEILNLITPLEGLSINEIKLSKVDFPAPDGPINE